MALRSDFQFSQNNLQDYLDCPRRFQLRHLMHQRWPALQSEPVLEQERHMMLGDRFHQLVQQHQLGISAEILAQLTVDTNLQQWWQQYLEHAPQDLPVKRYPEFTLTATFAGYRLLAKYDLLAVEPGQKVIILDWKTGLRPQSSNYLRERMQTRLYPMLVVLAGMCINQGLPIIPEQVTMIYWFACAPDQRVIFNYSQAQFAADMQTLTRLIGEISAHKEARFSMAVNEKTCKYCTYRSLCGRGECAPEWAESEDDLESLADIDFNQIGEIGF